MRLSLSPQALVCSAGPVASLAPPLFLLFPGERRVRDSLKSIVYPAETSDSVSSGHRETIDSVAHPKRNKDSLFTQPALVSFDVRFGIVRVTDGEQQSAHICKYI